MVFICSTCGEKYPDKVEMCEKCDGFAIFSLTEQDSRQIIAKPVPAVCTHCGSSRPRSVAMIPTNATKGLYVAGVAVGVLASFITYRVLVAALPMERIPLIVLIPSGLLPALIFFRIGANQWKPTVFTCQDCGSDNAI